MKRHFFDKTIHARRLPIQSSSASTGGEPPQDAAPGRSQGEEVMITSLPPTGHAKSKVILSLSDDATLDHDLRSAALERGQIIIRVVSIDAAVRMLHTNCCGVGFLDLDLARKIGWDAADCLLREANCPPVILLSGECDRFELKMAVQAGAIANKSAGAEKLLRLAEIALRESPSPQAERNAIQRVILRWLSPRPWSVSRTAAHRFWGINE